MAREKLEEIQRTLGAGTRAVGDAKDAAVVGDSEASKAALDEAMTELGSARRNPGPSAGRVANSRAGAQAAGLGRPGDQNLVRK